MEVHLTKVKHVTRPKNAKPGQVKLKGQPKLITVNLRRESERLERLAGGQQAFVSREARLELEREAEDDGLGDWIIKGGPLRGRRLKGGLRSLEAAGLATSDLLFSQHGLLDERKGAEDTNEQKSTMCASSCLADEEWCFGLSGTSPYSEEGADEDLSCNVQPASSSEQAWWDAWAERVQCWWLTTPHRVALQATYAPMRAHACTRAHKHTAHTLHHF